MLTVTVVLLYLSDYEVMAFPNNTVKVTSNSVLLLTGFYGTIRSRGTDLGGRAT
jgi:hypothetical protein